MDIEADLAEVSELCRIVRPAEAEGRMLAILQDLSDEDLRAAEPTLRATIQSAFLRKRGLALMAVLNARLAPPSGSHAVSGDSEVKARLTEFESTLKELSERHLFQWSTYYRDWLARDFNWFLMAGERYPDYPGLLKQIHSMLRVHAREVFFKGYQYQVGQFGNRKSILERSLSWPQSFINLLIEFYSAELPSAMTAQQARRLRVLNSCMLSAILHGYCDIEFGRETGSFVLLQDPKSWVDTIRYLTGGHVRELLRRFGRTDPIMINLVSVLEALDQLGDGRKHMPLPAVSKLFADGNGLDILLQPSALAVHSQMIELICYFSGDAVSSADLNEAAKRGVAAIIAPDRPRLRAELQRQATLREIVITTRGDNFREVHEKRRIVCDLLIARAFRGGVASVRSRPLTFNFARGFPLNDPHVLRFFRVNRQSARGLLRRFEARSGVRLWCSVRHSGKTTAVADLGLTADQVTVVSQTCDSTSPSPYDGLFYTQVLEAIEAGQQLPTDFMMDAVRSATGNHSYDRGRYVLVLDEYETLFSRLRFALRDNYDLRYTVVQPLLSQMARFSRDNLLIFLGQQPDAHYLLMDQNQSRS